MSDKILKMPDQDEYERRRKIYEDGMRQWENLDHTATEMDSRFDKALFTIAAGSFGISFAFIDSVVPLASASYTQVLLVSWACFAACIIVMILGHFLSAEAYRTLRDETALAIQKTYNGEPVPEKRKIDFVTPCNVASFLFFIGGVACLLSFVFLNL
jgi:hypothetical protein